MIKYFFSGPLKAFLAVFELHWTYNSQENWLWKKVPKKSNGVMVPKGTFFFLICLNNLPLVACCYFQWEKLFDMRFDKNGYHGNRATPEKHCYTAVAATAVTRLWNNLLPPKFWWQVLHKYICDLNLKSW